MEARKEKEEQEERLRILLQSPQTTPALPSLGSPSETYTFSSLQSGSSRSQPSSPFNSNQDGNQVKASSSRLPTPSSFNYRTMPLYFLYVSKLYLQLHWLPRIKSLFLKASRSAFYLTASALPMLASLVDIEIERMEIYHQESEAVLRVGRIHGDFSMALVTQKGKDGNPCNFSLGDSDLDGREAEDGDENQQAMSQRLSDALYSMSGRIGEGAKGAASYVRTGIPAGKGASNYLSREFKSSKLPLPKNLLVTVKESPPLPTVIQSQVQLSMIPIYQVLVVHKLPADLHSRTTLNPPDQVHLVEKLGIWILLLALSGFQE